MSLLAKVLMPADSGLPEDTVTNSWCIQGPSPASHTGPEMEALSTAIINFYNAVPAAQPDNVSGYFSPRLSRIANAADVLLYRIPDSGVNLGSPIYSKAWTLGAVGSSAFTPLPDELACCLSLAADFGGEPESIPAGPLGPEGDLRPRARRRGRIFLGPLNSAALSTAPTEQSRPSTEFTSVVLAATAVLRDAITAAYATYELGIWSRVDGEERVATSAWIDNAWDIQRRRGRRPSSRTTVLL